MSVGGPRSAAGIHRPRFKAGVFMTNERIESWRTWMQAEGHGRNTVTPRVRRVQLFAESIDREPEDATTEDVVNYLAGLDVGKSTRATYHSHLRSWFLWLVTTEYRDDNPMDRMRPPKTPRREPRPVTDRELRAILKVRVRKRTRMMLYLAAFQGLRVHEIAKIRGEDVNLKDGLLTVLGKGEVAAVLQLHPEVAALAQDFPRRGYWFVTHIGNSAGEKGRPILARSVSNILCQVFARAGVAGGAHRLRHWHATSLVKEGNDVRVVQTLMRHASLSTTALYTKVDVAQQRAAINSLHVPEVPEDEHDEAV